MMTREYENRNLAFKREYTATHEKRFTIVVSVASSRKRVITTVLALPLREGLI